MRTETARRLFVATVALFACLPAAACADESSFHHGVVGVRLADRDGESAAWSPDGRWIVVPARVGFRLRNVETDEVRRLKAPPFRGFPVRPGPLAWSPDGETIRYVTSFPRPTTGNASWLTEARVDGSGFRRVTLGVKALSVDWTSQGWPFAYATGPYAFDFDKGPLGPKPSLFVVDEFGAEPRRIALIPNPKGEEDLTEPVLSPDGKRLAFQRWGRRSSVTIWTAGTDGSDPEPLVRGLVAAFTVEWAPNGRLLALGAHSSVRGGQRVYTVPAGGGRLRRIVDEEILDGPAWSPDGRWLAYSTYEGQVWRVHPDGSGRQLIAEVPGEWVRDLLWGPDSRHLAYAAEPPPRSD
jgi:Tol biopolymer transport system component